MERLEEAVRDLRDLCRSDLCRRLKRRDLGREVYEIAKDLRVSEELLRSLRDFAPAQDRQELEEPRPAPPTPTLPQPMADPALGEKLAWAAARLASIRNAAGYEREAPAIKEFVKVIGELHPNESGTVVALIQEASTVVETFARTPQESRDARRVLYERAANWESRLAQLMSSGALPGRLSDIVAPYRTALEQVVGDLSRQSGVGPSLDVSIENPFLSPDSDRGSLLIRATNKSERAVTEVTLTVHPETPMVTMTGTSERTVAKLEPLGSAIVSFPLVATGQPLAKLGDDITFALSLKASTEGAGSADLGIVKKRIPVKRLADVLGMDRIPMRFQPGRSLRPSEPALFQGRGELLSRIQGSFHGGIQRERYFLDGIRRVGKTSILGFLPQYLPENMLSVLVDFDKFGLQGPIDSAFVLQHFCELIVEACRRQGVACPDVPSEDVFHQRPAHVFTGFLNAFRAAVPDRTILLMIDEFQDLLSAIGRSGAGMNQDKLVLDQLRGHLDDGAICAIFTGSVRFDRLSEIVDHRIFGSPTRLRVSFLSSDNIADVLSAGLGGHARILPEATHKIFELTGGYPWLVQTYGARLVDIFNEQERTVAGPDDVDEVTRDSVLCNDELFTHWWPADQLGLEEERLIERLLRNYSADQSVSLRDFIADIHSREQPAFRRAFENLRACEVLDSTQTNALRLGGEVLRQWLEQHTQDGHLRLPRVRLRQQGERRGQAAIVVDHENFVKSLERISIARRVALPSESAEKTEWFAAILRNVLSEAEHRLGSMPEHKVTVAFWSRPNEARFLSAYFSLGFRPEQPEPVKLENAVDFKVADEVRRAREQAMREGTVLGRVIIVTGDGDLSHAARALVNDGAAVQIWAGSRSMNQQYVEIVGKENIVALDDVCGI